MSSAEDEQNPYELLDVKLEATEQEIRTAYRQRSLKVHPDRNSNNPDAARKFHELNQAYELLLDPLRRLALDAKQRVKEARKQRFASYDNKRKVLVEELEERERVFKKARMEKQKEEVDRWRETEKIKEEGRKLREDREKELKKREEEQLRESADTKEDDTPSLGSLDTTIRLKYLISSHSTLTTPESLSALLATFGPTDPLEIVLSMKPPKKAPTKPPKYATALVPFKQIGDAFAAVCASGRAGRGLEGIEIGWAEGKEPPILGWLKKMGKLGTPTASPPPYPGGMKAGLPQQSQTAGSSSSPFSSFPESFPSFASPSLEPKTTAVTGIDYESLTLMRLRQAEKERLEREIREQEAQE